MPLHPIFLLKKGGAFSDVSPSQAQVFQGRWLPGMSSRSGLRVVPAEENSAGVLEGLQHSRRCRPHEVTAVERGLPRGLEASLQLHQVSAHLVPPEPAHDGVDGL